MGTTLLSRSTVLLLLVLALFSVSCNGRATRILRKREHQDEKKTPNAPEKATAVFFGGEEKVPFNASLMLTFVPTFGKGAGKTDEQGIVLKGVLSNKGKLVITNSTCGSYDAGKTVYSADARCMWSLVKYIDHDPRIYIAAPAVDGPGVIYANESGKTVGYSAYALDAPEGWYFTILSRAAVPVKLTKIKVTSADFQSTRDLPDVTLPAASG